jgi:hypothetical protein
LVSNTWGQTTWVESTWDETTCIQLYHYLAYSSRFKRLFAKRKKRQARTRSLWSHRLQIPLPHLIRFRIWISHVIGHLQKYVKPDWEINIAVS